MSSSEDIVIINGEDGVSATVHLFGATITSWKCHGKEMLFVSSKSLFDKKKAIRGGIPVVFPNFGPWDLGPQHGFARVSKWTVKQLPTKHVNGSVSALFELEDNDFTRSMWNHKFHLIYTVTLGKTSMETSLKIENKDDKVFDFTCLLHTYLSTPDVTQVTVSGLQGLTFIDKVKGGAEGKEERTLVTVNENVDRIYKSTPAEHSVTNCSGGHTIVIKKTNLPDTVVWNPWLTAAKMVDFGNDEYASMLCVEPGNVANRLELQPGSFYECSQLITCEK